MNNTVSPDELPLVGELGPVPPRPTARRDAALRLGAAKVMADKMMKSGVLDKTDDIDWIAEQIEQAARCSTDGYEIARELERRYSWDCDFEIADKLEKFSWILSSLEDAAQLEWATKYKVTAQLRAGSRVRLLRSKETGIIDEICKWGVAKYTVAIDGDPDTGSRRIVNFEDAEAIE